jgi:hypothetical protein
VVAVSLKYNGESLRLSGTYWYLLLAVAGGAVIAFILLFLLRQGSPAEEI